MARDELESFRDDLLSAANDLGNGRHTKKFLRKEGAKLNKENKKQARSSGIARKTGKFMKGFKRGKPYKFEGDSLSIRSFNGSPQAHLLDQGHIIVDRNGEEHGFKEGEHFMDKAERTFKGEYGNDVEEFLDDLLDNHGL